MVEEQSEFPPANDDPLAMPTTAYLVLGVLKVVDERLTAGEIKIRAEHTVGKFYWSPAVSHIRRELTRLLHHSLVVENVVSVGRRSMTIYEITPAGEDVLDTWVAEMPEGDVVIKHPTMIKLWLSNGDTDLSSILSVLDRHLERTQEQILKAQWAVRRGQEVGRSDNPESKFPRAVNAYVLDSLYSELANIRKLRDGIEWTWSPEIPDSLHLSESQLRPREHGDGSVSKTTSEPTDPLQA